VVIHIDPHLPGTSAIRLGDLTPQVLNGADLTARELTEEPTTMAELRLRGATAMRAAAELVGHDGRGEQPVVVDATSPGSRAVVHQTLPTAPASTIAATHTRQFAQRQITPLQAFQRPMASTFTGPEVRAVDMQRQLPAAGPSAPGIEVTFEMERWGVNRAYYHDVLIQNGVIILIYDTRWQGPRYFPPADRAEQPAMAMNITGRSDVYLVQATAIQFVHGHEEFCVLLVEQSGQLPQEATHGEAGHRGAGPDA
jgi:hypothetical protein